MKFKSKRSLSTCKKNLIDTDSNLKVKTYMNDTFKNLKKETKKSPDKQDSMLIKFIDFN